ncbi:MAG: P-type ATPase [Trebouxia sp. A1-2]|nr:MAG: P-type ATPase [Trebouxia sp. A1-2]
MAYHRQDELLVSDFQPASSVYGVTLTELTELNENKDISKLEACGGVHGLAKSLLTSTTEGITPTPEGDLSLEHRRRIFGANAFKEVKQKAFWSLLFENLQDPTLILLMVAALVSTVLGVAIREERLQHSWTEGVAIWVAVIVVSGVGAGNDYQKDKQFRKLNEKKDLLDVKMIRGGAQVLIPNPEIVVGDVIILQTGDKITADGIVIDSNNMVVDEASLTGESEPIKKGSKDMFCRAGTTLNEGSGSILVVAVGVNTEYGKTMSLVMTEAASTPLQEHLEVLAASIGKVGFVVAVICFIVLLIRWCVEYHGFPVKHIADGPLAFFIFGVTIVVVAVPEGLPLAVTISLAYSMKKMMKDNNFVRVLAACETMGGATAICSDKTGTLTENRMTVVEGWFAGKKYDKVPQPEDLPADFFNTLQASVAVNSSAFLIIKDPIEFVGNRTECALLMLLRAWGSDYKTIRDSYSPMVEKVWDFDSAKKMAEMVLRRCTKAIGTDGSVISMSTSLRAELEESTTGMAARGLRTLCITYRDFAAGVQRPADFFEEAPDTELICCAITGIKDPVRKEVPDAVAVCKRAGIFVRMVTGDNVHTASHIARECGIMMEGGLALEGPTFRKMTEEELIPILPKIQVMARSSPTDKYNLVKLLKKTGEVVAVTGDGTNDAPALKESDVGLAMGIAGTEVAKEAADIVIMDDNFSSIVKSVLWGRSFQLTVNFVALVIAFVSALTKGETPLTVIQLLWVNLIMDALGALALATEAPTPDLLLMKPHGRGERIINNSMWKHIFTQGCYQLFWLFLIIYGADKYIGRYKQPTECSTYSSLDLSYLTVETLSVVANQTGGTFDVCCSGDDCYTANGGIYLTGEVPVCNTSNSKCVINDPAKHPDLFCTTDTASPTNCQRYQEFHSLYSRGTDQHTRDLSHAQEKSNSVVFNCFIFFQIFNQINSRKIRDEYNPFAGLLSSATFLYILVIEVVLQVIIMLTPVNTFFTVYYQSWQEWLFAIGVAAGCMLVSLLVKLISR